MKSILFSLTAFLCCLFAQAQTTDSIATQRLDTVLLTSSRIKAQVQKVPAAVSVFVSKNEDAERQQLSLQEYVAQMPGVYTQNANNFAQDLRISIRGFGARAAFGIRGIKLIVDGIPETTPDGQGQLDNLNLGIINRIEVLKGPSSSLYGNASGGVISIQTIDAFEKAFSRWKVGVGAYGFQNYQVTAGIGDENANYIFHGNYSTSSGYRDQSGFEQINTNFRGNFRLSETVQLKTILNYSDSPQAADAGGLTLEEVRENRRQARDRNILFETGETVRQLKVGTSLTWTQSEFVTLEGYAFYSRRDFEGKLPFGFGGAIDLKRNYFGQGTNLSYNKGGNTLKFGYDFAYQNDSRQRFENLEGEIGNTTLNQKERFTNVGVFITDHYEFGKWYLTTGLRYDYNKLVAKDSFLSNGNDSGNLSLNAFNPSVGASYAVLTNPSNGARLNLYANFSTSFETPSLSELSADPEGGQGFNKSLKAQQANNYEIGLKGTLRGELQYQLALFRIDTKNDLVPFELAAFPDRNFFRNAGKTRRNGLEIEASYAFAKAWTLSGSYAYSDFSYRNFTTEAGDFKDNFLPGIPKHFTSVQLAYTNANGLHATLTANLVGELYANDSNEALIEGYELVNFRTGYHFTYKGMRLSPYLGVNNLLDTAYTDNVRINAFGGRFYEPAPRFNAYAGLVLGF